MREDPDVIEPLKASFNEIKMKLDNVYKWTILFCFIPPIASLISLVLPTKIMPYLFAIFTILSWIGIILSCFIATLILKKIINKKMKPIQIQLDELLLKSRPYLHFSNKLHAIYQQTVSMNKFAIVTHWLVILSSLLCPILFPFLPFLIQPWVGNAYGQDFWYTPRMSGLMFIIAGVLALLFWAKYWLWKAKLETLSRFD